VAGRLHFLKTDIARLTFLLSLRYGHFGIMGVTKH